MFCSSVIHRITIQHYGKEFTNVNLIDIGHSLYHVHISMDSQLIKKYSECSLGL